MTETKNLEGHLWGGSGIERVLFDFILNTIPEGSTIVELGSGYCSTKAFSAFYKTYSVDDNVQYQNLFEGVNYIYANNINGWYNRQSIVDNLPEEYSLVFVDGTSGEGNRNGLLNNLDIFRDDVTFIFHDTYRVPEKNLAIEVANALGKSITFYEDGDFWAVVK